MSTETKARKIQPKITPLRDDYFMGILLVASAACKDPNGQQTALLVDSKDRWISVGINFIPPAGPTGHKKLDWTPENRDVFMTSAIDSAMDRALKLYIPGSTISEPFVGHTLYSLAPPMLRDIRRMAANGLKEVYYGPLRPQYFNEDDLEQTKKAASEYNIKLNEYKGNLNWVRDRVWSLSHLF